MDIITIHGKVIDTIYLYKTSNAELKKIIKNL